MNTVAKKANQEDSILVNLKKEQQERPDKKHYHNPVL